MNAIIEDLGPATRKRSKPGGLEVTQHTLDIVAAPINAGQVNNFHRGERLDMQLRIDLVDSLHHVRVISQRKPGVKAADDVELGCTGFQSPRGLAPHLVEIKFVSAFLALLAV